MKSLKTDMSPHENASVQNHPVIVDLDGTLINTDMLHELAVKLLGEKPLIVFQFPSHLMKGKARLKQFISSQTTFRADLLPYNLELIEWLKNQKSEGRTLVLCTAADISIATPIAEHIGIFDEVMASDGITNLSGSNKARALVEKYGKGQFDYCGNAEVDLKVWEDVDSAVVVNASDQLLAKAKRLFRVSHVIEVPKKKLNTILKAVHFNRWSWNLMVFIPLLVSHYFGVMNSSLFTYSSLIIYFLASLFPVVKDLISLEKDRSLSSTQPKPFASGKVSILFGSLFILIMSSILIFLIACI